MPDLNTWHLVMPATANTSPLIPPTWQGGVGHVGAGMRSSLGKKQERREKGE